MKKRFLAILGSLALLAGCGGGSLSVNGHPCNKHDYVAQCALQGQKSPPIHRNAAGAVAQGIDFAWSCPIFNDRNFGASYLSYDFSKNWSTGCVSTYLNAHESVVFVWETSAARATAGCNAGVSDARAAASQLQRYGVASNQPFTMAIDFDASGPDVAGYFQCASQAEPGRVNAYGGYRPLAYLCSKGYVGHLNWQTYAWSGGAWLPASCAPLEQYLNSNAFDYDRAVATDYGQYPRPAPPVPPAPHWAVPGCFNLSPYDQDFCFGQRYGLGKLDAKWRSQILNYRLRHTGWLSPSDKASYVDHSMFLAVKAFQAKHGHIHDPSGTVGGQTWGELKRTNHEIDLHGGHDAGAPF